MSRKTQLATAILEASEILATSALSEANYSSHRWHFCSAFMATRAGKIIFVGGIIGIDPNGKTFVSSGITSEASEERQAPRGHQFFRSVLSRQNGRQWIDI